MKGAPDLLRLSNRERPEESTDSVRIVIYWAVALMILIMTCTGLRRQSVLSLEIHDWMELRQGLFGLVWRHWKGRSQVIEERLMRPSIVQYLEFLHTKRCTPVTLKVIRHDLIHFVTWWESTWQRTFDPAFLQYEDFCDWRAARQRDHGAAPATINRGLASLRGYCR